MGGRVSQHAIGQGCEGVGCGGEVNFWYNLLLWSSGVPSGLPFCYGLLVWPSGWECPSVMTFWCTPLPAHPTGIHSCLDFNLRKFTKRIIEGKL